MADVSPISPAEAAEVSTRCHRNHTLKENHPHAHQQMHSSDSSTKSNHSNENVKNKNNKNNKNNRNIDKSGSRHRTSKSRHGRTRARLPPPSQFVIEKQGRFEEDVWRTRVLTLDATHHRLYLSKATEAADLYHRCMVRIDTVKLWPSYNSLRIGEDFQSAAAQRTVCVKGLVGVKASALSFATRLFGPSPKTVRSTSLVGRLFTRKKDLTAHQDEIDAAQRATARHRNPQLLPASGTHVAEVSDFGEFTMEVWMVRTMTPEDLVLLARALRRTMSTSCALTGYRRALATAQQNKKDAAAEKTEKEDKTERRS